MNKSNTMTSPYKSGYLEIILGSMYSGKTTRLVEIYNQCKFCDISVVAINHEIDSRYDVNHTIVSHDKTTIPCIKTHKLTDIWSNHSMQRIQDHNIIATSNVILINEGQFFPDLLEFITSLLNHGKQVYVCGLDGDFERKKFGQILDLIPLCDKVTKLTSLCSLCKNGTPGIFSMRLTGETQQTVVGSENYIPVCRECYVSKNKNI